MIDNYDGPIFKYDSKLPFCINNIPMGGMVKVEYLNTIDGDTAYFKVGNTSESVRFYLINTPEVYNNEPYAKFAKEYTKQALENAKEIYIQSDPNNLLRDNTESRRILAYLWIDKKLFNYVLLKEGLATIKYVLNENVMYLDELRKAESYAKEHAINIYSNVIKAL